MAKYPIVNHRVVLNSRPDGMPKLENFRLESAELSAPQPGQLLLKTLHLSLDPYMRGMMNDNESYIAPISIGDVMFAGGIARVEHSEHPDYQQGEYVLAYTGWQEYSLSDGSNLIKLPEQNHPLSHYLGVLGMPGYTGYMGLLDIGQPKAGETVVVAAASGAVGSVVGQVAKIYGCRVIGIAGGTKKCRYVTEELGFDLCLDHHQDDLAQQLAKACPNGIDIYFENVGGKVFDAVFPLLNTKARIPLCGLISQYNATHLPPEPDRLPLLMGTMLSKRIRMQGFIIAYDYPVQFNDFIKQMGLWVTQGKVKTKEDIVIGLEHAPAAFIGLLQGRNFGKLIVTLAE